MLKHLFASPKRLAALILLPVILAHGAPALGQEAQDEERARAFELFADQQFTAALPLLEKLAKKYPDDGGVIARLGFSIFANAQTAIKDPEQRKKERARARATLLRARDELGVRNELIETLIATIPPDGGERAGERFSENKVADEAMRAGEAAFVRGDLDAALKAYERALQLDPKLYEAPLFAGDVYLKRQEWDKAGEWYARAVAINPDRETAYRYWGNAYLRQAKLEEARDKYVEAIIAEPYNGYVWNNGLIPWADAKGIRLGHPKIEPPVNISQKGDKQMTISVDPKSLEAKGDGSGAWMMYGLSRAAWSANDHERFRKEYPGEKSYRHSLREEADALRGVVEAVRRQTKGGEIKRLDPMLEQLVKLHDEGLLEAYILFARTDEGIAQDYAEYRKSNRDKLRRYLVEYVASGKY